MSMRLCERGQKRALVPLELESQEMGTEGNVTAPGGGSALIG